MGLLLCYADCRKGGNQNAYPFQPNSLYQRPINRSHACKRQLQTGISQKTSASENSLHPAPLLSGGCSIGAGIDFDSGGNLRLRHWTGWLKYLGRQIVLCGLPSSDQHRLPIRTKQIFAAAEPSAVLIAHGMTVRAHIVDYKGIPLV